MGNPRSKEEKARLMAQQLGCDRMKGKPRRESQNVLKPGTLRTGKGPELQVEADSVPLVRRHRT